LDGKQLLKGDVLSAFSPHKHLHAKGRSLRPEWIPSYSKKWNLRVIPGPHDDHFPLESHRLFLNSSFEMTAHSDRTGIRLAGPLIEPIEGAAASIISEGVISGTIQVPGDGQPIIILNETVTGGYRKIATVISADLPLLGQIKPGDHINFELVSLDDAYSIHKAFEEKIQRLRESFSKSA
jgi:allophanate hydrolase subunit 2